MSRPLAEGQLWERLIETHAERLIVVISVADLRALGAQISRRLSWERTITDLALHLTSNTNFRPLTKAAALIIRIGIDGAFVLRGTEEKATATFLFDPQGYEDAYKEGYTGDMQGLTSAFVAALTYRLARTGQAGIDDGVRDGIIASRRIFRLGFGTDPRNPSYPGKGLITPPASKDGVIERIDIKDLRALEDDLHWTILQHLQRTRFEEIAGQIVRKGAGALKKPIPIARFNNLVVVDRDEIEAYQSIRNSLTEFVNNTDSKRPFSFAVFGPPGSGKIYGVREFSKALTDLGHIVPMTFNLSQFEGTQDLIGAFRQIRDSVLEGNLPLVFFDEFDTKREGQPLGWLRSFLTPMQDGIFKDGESWHPIGRAIFVFVSGTYHSFEDFVQRASAWHDPAVREATGIDFISRLLGQINIRGVDPGPNGSGRYLLRRALLLRSIIERTAKSLVIASGEVRIDDGVLRAFLMVPEYRHGGQSMQAIVEMSMLNTMKVFAPSSLPPTEQLALHVDAQIFRLLMLQDVLFERMVEPLAQAIHEEYLDLIRAGMDGQANSNTHSMAVPWDNLGEEFKEANRHQAREINVKLRAANCGISPTPNVEGMVKEFAQNRIELFAEMEHERWLQEKTRNGWRLGKRDDDKKLHPTLLPWDELSEEEKEKDRNAVRTIPKLLEKAGFWAYTLP